MPLWFGPRRRQGTPRPPRTPGQAGCQRVAGGLSRTAFSIGPRRFPRFHSCVRSPCRRRPYRDTGQPYSYARFGPDGRSRRKQEQSVDNGTTWPQRWQNGLMPRFLTLADVAEQLQINSPAAYALVRSGELKAIQVGGRGQWRVEEKMLEQYIQERYAEASRMIEEAKSRAAGS